MKPKPARQRPAREDRRRRKRAPQILIITGLSGSGKTHVARALEDVGWFCVDNLPSALIPTFADQVAGHLAGRAGSESRRKRRRGSRRSAAPPSPHPQLQRSALVVDIREPEFLKQFPRVLQHLRARGVAVSLLFLEADEKALARRYNETRRPHPMAVNQPAIEGIREEREALKPIRKVADLVLDTSDYTVHQLRDYIREHYDVRHQAPPIVLSVMSFGYKFGVPSEADLVFDCRFLPNPNFVPSLKPLTGNHAPVIRYMKRQADTDVFLRKLRAFLGYVLPRYVKEGKSYLTVAVGCTGGRHRSVMIANSLGQWLEKLGYPVKVRHRDLRQENAG